MDDLHASGARDSIDGGAGNDVLRAGDGANRLIRGAGGDCSPGFASGVDELAFVTSRLRGGCAAGMDLGVAGRLLYDAATARLLLDLDGTGAAAASPIATSDADTRLTAADFTILA